MCYLYRKNNQHIFHSLPLLFLLFLWLSIGRHDHHGSCLDRNWNASSSLACSWLTGSFCDTTLREGLGGWIPMSVCEVNWGRMKFPLSLCLPASDVDVQPCWFHSCVLSLPELMSVISAAKTAALVCVNLGLLSQVSWAHWLIGDYLACPLWGPA